MFPAKFAVEVEAVRWNPADPLAAGVVAGWLFALGVECSFPDGVGGNMAIAIDDVGTALPGDWIARGPKNFYIMPGHAFESRHTLIEPTEVTNGGAAMPKSKPVGNTDDSKRGRDIQPKSTGRPSKGGRLSGKQNDPKTIGPDDYEGHKIGRRGK